MAAGAAFTFGYAEHPELLAAAGAEVVSFDPLRDERFRRDRTAWSSGAASRRIHAVDLSANTRLRARSRRWPGGRARSPSAPGCCTWRDR